MTSNIVSRIDNAPKGASGMRAGARQYAQAVNRYLNSGRTDTDYQNLCNGVIDCTIDDYCAACRHTPSIVSFNDRGIEFLFDTATDRTLLVFGQTQATAPNSRDNNYHKQFPRRDGHEKGHAFAHAQGGFEGGPNYFFQRAALNRRLSAKGHLWRDIETHLAANPGSFAFVRLIYPRNASADIPSDVEYGLVADQGQFRSVIFCNR